MIDQAGRQQSNSGGQGVGCGRPAPVARNAKSPDHPITRSLDYPVCKPKGHGMAITREHTNESHLVYGHEARVSGKTLIDQTHRVPRIYFMYRNHSYQQVLNHAECCPPYNTFKCEHYNCDK